MVQGKYFYHLKLESEMQTPRHQTLLISDKNEFQLEIYFNEILDIIKRFIEGENKNNRQQDEIFYKCEDENKLPLKEVVKDIKFIDLFYNTNDAEHCLSILRDLDKPLINSRNEYIGINKGKIPLWINLLKNHSKALVKHFPDKIYVKALNQEIKNLRLTSDASEFRKTYKRVENSDLDLEIKSLLSQLSQDGKLGK